MFYPIDDLDDPRVAEYRNIPDPELLLAHGLFVAEGRHVVRCLLASDRFEARSVLVSPAALDGLQDALGTHGALPVYVMAVERLTALLGFNLHRGCLAIGVRPKATSVASWWQEAAGSRLVLAVERVGNADNLGAVFRNALAFGAGGVLLSPGCCDPLYRKSIRVSTGAALRIPYAVDDRWPDSLRRLRDAGARVLALTPQPPARDLDAVLPGIAPGTTVALLLGHEGDGLSESAMGVADERVRIAIRPGVDSLNVATAAAIALYACRRRLGWPDLGSD
ncbi:MAG: RNA methyltransferase [Vicinamibacterales bacterium]|jgi:tRNA G18 (ribose-2'-O)-methylase SpoU|nr:RNA methyltransferase [Vicinamibacterales bacterium]